jgi:ADP-heptose:LPS heptosyltransferase
MMRLLKHLKSIINAFLKYLFHLFGYYFIKPFIGKPKLQNLEKLKPYRILYVCLAFRGDMVVNFPAITALKEHFPNSNLTCWVRDYNRPLIGLHSEINGNIIYDRFNNSVIRTLAELIFGKKHKLFIDKLRSYDIYIDDSGYAFTALAGFYSKIPYRVGRNFQGFGFLNHYEEPLNANMQLIERRLKPLQFVGIKISLADIPKPYLKIDMERYKSIQNQFEIPSGEYYTVQPFTGWSAKNWGLEKYCSIAGQFSKRSGLVAVFLGSEAERPLIDQAILRHGLHAINAAGIVQIDQSAAIFAGARLHLGGDSVGNHLAIALGVKSLAIFGPTNPILSAYLGDINIAVRKKSRCTPEPDKIYCCFDGGQSCQHISCMTELNEADVLEVLLKLWSGEKLPPVLEY